MASGILSWKGSKKSLGSQGYGFEEELQNSLKVFLTVLALVSTWCVYQESHKMLNPLRGLEKMLGGVA